MIKEIEVKAKVFSKEKVREYFTERGCIFSPLVTQHDRYFCNFGGDFAEWRPYTNFLRIRKENEKVFLTLKQPQANELDVIEKTLVIHDEETATQLICLLGYHEAVSVKKERETTVYGEYTVCLDSVESLGDFIEIEYIGEKDAEVVQKGEKDLLFEIGVIEEDVVILGYDTMIYKKMTIKENKM